VQEPIGNDLERAAGRGVRELCDLALRALMNFLSLRNHEHAQREIAMYAHAMETMVSTVVPVAMSAFQEHGRRCP